MQHATCAAQLWTRSYLAHLALLCLLVPQPSGRQLLGKAAQGGAGTVNVLLIGDYGYHSTPLQQRVAAQMERLAATVKPAFVLSLGDNFYGPDGVQSTTDTAWLTHWYKVYKANHPHLAPLPWHAVLGNHDYCANARAQIKYNSFGWRMDNFFWLHTTRAGGKSVAMVYVDTNLLAYGEATEHWLMKGCSQMHAQFRQFASAPGKWTQDSHLATVRNLLNTVKGYDYIFVAGHHPIGGGACVPDGRLGDLRTLLESYPVSAYLHGHVHAMDFSMHKGIAHIMSGAGGDPGRNCKPQRGYSSQWQTQHTVGFAQLEVASDGFTVHFYNGDGVQLYSQKVPRRHGNTTKLGH